MTASGNQGVAKRQQLSTGSWSTEDVYSPVPQGPQGKRGSVWTNRMEDKSSTTGCDGQSPPTTRKQMMHCNLLNSLKNIHHMYCFFIHTTKCFHYTIKNSHFWQSAFIKLGTQVLPYVSFICAFKLCCNHHISALNPQWGYYPHLPWIFGHDDYIGHDAHEAWAPGPCTCIGLQTVGDPGNRFTCDVL